MVESQIKDLELTLDIKQREREKEDQRKGELLDEIAALKEEIDRESRFNEKMIADKVLEQEEKDIDDLKGRIDESNKQIQKRKDEIDQTDTNINKMSENKLTRNNDQYELQEKYRNIFKELEENRKRILDNRVKTEYLDYQKERLLPQLAQLEPDINRMQKEIPKFEEENE